MAVYEVYINIRLKQYQHYDLFLSKSLIHPVPVKDVLYRLDISTLQHVQITKRKLLAQNKYTETLLKK